MAAQQEVPPSSPPTTNGVLDDSPLEADEIIAETTTDPNGTQAAASEDAPPPDPRDLEIERLQSELETQVELVTNIKRQHAEAIGEFNNAKVRLKREVGREVQTSLKSLISELLETVDNLDRAIDTASGHSEESELQSGVVMIRDQFITKLGNFNVVRLNAQNADFNPNLHEAISMMPVADPAQDGKVISVIKEGYTMNGEVLRPAVVAVGKHTAPPEDAKGDSNPETQDD